MTPRIKKLREKTLSVQPYISLERAELLTEFYNSPEANGLPIPIQRAKAFEYILLNKKLYVEDGELIVGERGPAPHATPTYPEICIHTESDLEILDTREKISFTVDARTRAKHLNTISPFWSGNSMREKIFASVDDNWKEAYSAGIFTEFMEQRAPGHTVLDEKIYKNGFRDFINKIDQVIAKLDFISDNEAVNKRNELNAMKITAEAVIKFSKRYSAYLTELSKNEKSPERKNELETMAGICERVPENKPNTFWEALQYYWFVHLGVITELNTWDSFNPGRIDLNMYPLYQRDLDSGLLDKDHAKELLMSFWVKFHNQPAPPKVGVTAQESNTYTDFCLINVGGVDERGQDATNDLTYLILDVIEDMRLLQPSSMVQISKKNPDKLVKRALDIIKTGFGQPSLFNTDAIIQEMLRQGKDIIDARLGGASGCVETGAFGKESYILTGYFNMVKILELTLNNGYDKRTKKQLGPETGVIEDFRNFQIFMTAFRKQLEYFIDIKIKGNRIIEKLWAEYLPAPFLSILVDDCISSAKDYNAGGARYNSSYIQGVGLGTLTDSLASIKHNVFETKSFTFAELKEKIDSNFDGDIDFRKILTDKSPKYGNDDNRADDLLIDIFEMYFQLIDGKPNTKGGQYRINLLPTTCHVYFGSVVGATPDGRYAGVPLSEGISPVQGADTNGPTAVIKSASKIDHLRTGGTLLNQKFTPDILSDESNKIKILHLIRTYFKLDGHHIQFNVVDANTLREAQKNPEMYRDLIVRVAGYSDYFINLGNDLQEEIIRRTEQEI
ncbi:MAG: glycyl radical enzyme [Melioribacteraceae bacterium]|nr:MAG: glycyl radical enzyme [Melioribacteraceae bacterium]